jgi:hypothetical protein
MALLAALGLTAGSLFSFPVAVFTAAAVLTLSVSSYYVNKLADSGGCSHCGHHHEAEAVTNLYHSMVDGISENIDIIIAPVMQFRPLGLLSDGLIVSWMDTGMAVLILVIVYPCFLGLTGGCFLGKRELAK